MGLLTGEVLTEADLVGSSALVRIATATGATLSLTTLANQRVVVIATGYQDTVGGTSPTLELKYDGVSKHSVVNGNGNNVPFTLMYSEIPGAGTKNVTVTTSAGTVANVVITALLLRLG